jgi:hypothetical protein
MMHFLYPYLQDSRTLKKYGYGQNNNDIVNKKNSAVNIVESCSLFQKDGFLFTTFLLFPLLNIRWFNPSNTATSATSPHAFTRKS